MVKRLPFCSNLIRIFRPVQCLLIGILFFASSIISAQCPIGSFTINNQSELEDYIQVFSNCDSIPSSLTVQGDITDISGLSFIKHIEGDLRFSNLTAKSLTGVEGIGAIGGSLTISNCDSLSTVSYTHLTLPTILLV